MSSVQSGSSSQPLRRFVSAAPFPKDIFSYTVVTEPYSRGVLVPVPGASARSCPAGRVLRESGKKLYPGVNQGVKTYMVGVIDTQSGISGFIDPNSPLFALYSTDLPAVMKDGRDPGPQGKKDVGPPLYTNGNMYVAQNGKIDGTLRVNVSYTNDANMETAGFSTMSGATLSADDVTVSSLKGGDLNVSTIDALNIMTSSFQTGNIVAVTGQIDELQTVQLSASTIVASTIVADISIIQAAVLSSFGGVNGGAVNFSATHFSTVDASITSLIADAIQVSTLGVTSLEVANRLIAYEGTISTLRVDNMSSIITYASSLQSELINVSSLFVFNDQYVKLFGAIEAGISSLECHAGKISSLNASSIQSEEIAVSSLNASSIVSNEIAISTLHSYNIVSENISVSTLNLPFSSFNANDASISTLSVSTLTGESGSFTTLSVSSLNASSITLPADGVFSSLTVVGNGLISSLTLSTLGSDAISTNNVSIDSTLTVSSIISKNISVSTILSEGPIVSRGQIRASGQTGNRTEIAASSLVNLEVSNGPFFYVVGDGDYTITCNNFNFCDQMYLQTTGNGTLTFSTGFGVSESTMSTGQGMINFICDGFHMIELGRSRWAHTF